MMDAQSYEYYLCEIGVCAISLKNERVYLPFGSFSVAVPYPVFQVENRFRVTIKSDK